MLNRHLGYTQSQGPPPENAPRKVSFVVGAFWSIYRYCLVDVPGRGRGSPRSRDVASVVGFGFCRSKMMNGIVALHSKSTRKQQIGNANARNFSHLRINSRIPQTQNRVKQGKTMLESTSIYIYPLPPPNQKKSSKWAKMLCIYTSTCACSKERGSKQ